MPEPVAATLDSGAPGAVSDPAPPAGEAAGTEAEPATSPGGPIATRAARVPPGPAPGVTRWSRRVLAGATPLVAAAALSQAALLGRDIILLRWPSGTHPWNPDLFVSPLPLALLCVPALLAMVGAVLSGTAERVWSRPRGGTVLAMVLLAGPLEFRVAGLVPAGWPGGAGFALDERQWAWQAGCSVAVAALALVAGALARRGANPAR